MFRKRIALSCLLLSAALTALPAESGKFPDLSGNWKCNLSKSTFPMQAPSEMSAVMKDTPEFLYVKHTEVRGGTPRTVELKLDKSGKETVQTVGQMEVRTVLKLDGQVLREEAVFILPGGDKMVRKAIVVLSEDGKTIIKESVYTGPQGEMKEKVILEKQ